MYVFTFKQETYILVDIKKRHCGGTFKQVTKTIQILFPNIIFYYSSVFPFMGCALNPNMSKSVIFGIRKSIAACGQYHNMNRDNMLYTVFKVASQPVNYGGLWTYSADFFISYHFYSRLEIIAFPLLLECEIKLLAASGLTFS